MLRELGNKKLQGDCLMEMGEACAQVAAYYSLLLPYIHCRWLLITLITFSTEPYVLNPNPSVNPKT